MKKTVFEILGNRLKRKPDRYFDQTFWAKFDREFTARPRVGFFKNFVWASAAALALIIAFEFYGFQNRPPKELAESFIQDGELYQDLELFLTFEDVDLSEDEWRILVADSSGL